MGLCFAPAGVVRPGPRAAVSLLLAQRADLAVLAGEAAQRVVAHARRRSRAGEAEGADSEKLHQDADAESGVLANRWR